MKIKFVLVTILLLVFPHIASTAVPGTINYQGQVTDNAGTPLVGAPDITFKLYDASGTERWSETHHSVTITDGLFGVNLGSITGFDVPVAPAPAPDFSEAYVLGITIGTAAELSPRQPFTSVPYAMMARSVEAGSITSAAIANGAVGSAQMTPGSVTSSQLAAASVTASHLSGVVASDIGAAASVHDHDTNYVLKSGDTISGELSVNGVVQASSFSGDGSGLTGVTNWTSSNPAFGETWVLKETSRDWESVSISADGSRQTAVVNNGQIYISSDYGNTWAAKETNRYWTSVAISGDGKTQTAVESSNFGFNGVFVSSDFGNTWVAKLTLESFYKVAMSTDGTKQIVVGGRVWKSTDSGNSWISAPKPSPILTSLNAVAVSDDGTKITVGGDKLYVSIDSGNSWTAKGVAQNGVTWRSIAMSSDGTRQTAVSGPGIGVVYVSTDSGNTWVAKGPSGSWEAVSMSSDGAKQTVLSGQQLYVSTDFGNTWAAKGPAVNWRSVATSADGSIQAAVTRPGLIYESQSGQTTYMASGNIGIGVPNPTAALDIIGPEIEASMITGPLRVSTTGNSMIIDGNEIDSNSTAGLRLNNNSSEKVILVNGGGNVGIGLINPSYKLHVNGTAAGTSWTNTSSRDYKENIEYVTKRDEQVMLERLMAMAPAHYQYKQDHGGDGMRKLGFIAEEMPEAVLSKNGKGVDVYELVTYSIAAMKALKHEKDAQVASLKQELAETKSVNAERIAALESKVEMLVRAMASDDVAMGEAVRARD